MGFSFISNWNNCTLQLARSGSWLKFSFARSLCFFRARGHFTFFICSRCVPFFTELRLFRLLLVNYAWYVCIRLLFNHSWNSHHTTGRLWKKRCSDSSEEASIQYRQTKLCTYFSPGARYGPDIASLFCLAAIFSSTWHTTLILA